MNSTSPKPTPQSLHDASERSPSLSQESAATTAPGSAREEKLKEIEKRRALAIQKRENALVKQASRNAQELTPVAPVKTKVNTEPAVQSSAKSRHWGVLLSFLLFVITPIGLTGWYLWERAADQYASYVGFSVRTEETGSAIELLGGVAELSGSSSSDTDILYQFIQSQELVAEVDDALDLRALWSKANPDVDPVFSYHPPGQIEDLTKYWGRMVRVTADSGTGLIDLTVLAFTPQDAQDIATLIYDNSSEMINKLSAIAREDAIRYAREELEGTVERLKIARQEMNAFRNRTQIVDPAADISSQVGLLSSLQVQLAETLIELDLLEQTTRAGDPRISAAQRKVSVIEARISEERKKLGIGSGDKEGEVFANLVGEFESLTVDREFAEQSYTAALAAYDASQAEARRQTRYLAAHITPTLAQKAEYPTRILILCLTAVMSLLSWAMAVLIYYSLRDRR